MWATHLFSLTQGMFCDGPHFCQQCMAVSVFCVASVLLQQNVLSPVRPGSAVVLCLAFGYNRAEEKQGFKRHCNLPCINGHSGSI